VTAPAAALAELLGARDSSLPLAAAAKVWPYTPIGTLVTIEN